MFGGGYSFGGFTEAGAAGRSGTSDHDGGFAHYNGRAAE